jgi:ribosome biogenesis protein Nip4
MITKNLKFRKANHKEEELILSFIKNQFGFRSLLALVDLELWIREGKIKEAYAVPKKIIQLLRKIKKEVYVAGIPLGSFSDVGFQLEIEGAALILPFTEKILNVKTNQFLYGKPIFVSNIKSFITEFKKDDFLIIMGENNLHYGIGRAKIDSSNLNSFNSNSVIISEYKRKPMDRGWYLREGN